MKPILSVPLSLTLALALVPAMGNRGRCAALAATEITHDTVLDPDRTYGRLVIKASSITLDGRGAWIARAPDGRRPSARTGIGVLAEDVSHVTIKNVRAKGWETGLVVRRGHHWTIENCDFSDNFHDPQFGWGDHGRRGGILLEGVCQSVIRNNRANRVWDGCVLVDCHANQLRQNDFSHASNTCLRLWRSTRNQVFDNRFRYGIRKDPGEVHARDSAGVLIESGSGDNRFLRNDCRYGGDGIFIRVLNGWVSSGNWFQENDVSYANNNGFEAWAPRNTYVSNKASHCSYGFWLGASDQTRLEGNEASYNGLSDGNHNSPHLPDRGHAGIVFMFGPSSHTVVRGNTCIGNQGAGIALVGDQASQGRQWRAYHGVIQQNRLANNRWGVYLQYADWIDLAANTFQDNSEADVHVAEGVTRLIRRPDRPAIDQAPVARLEGPARARVGVPARWDASSSCDPAGRPLRFRWDLGDGSENDGEEVTHVFRRPGFYRLGLSVNNGLLTDLGWRDLYVTDTVAERGTEGEVAAWTWVDPHSTCRFQADRAVRLCGDESLRATVEPYGGGRVTLVYRVGKPAIAVSDRTRIVFWLRVRNENIPAWQNTNPVVTLADGEGRSVSLTPAVDLLSHPPQNEAREGWTYCVVPVAGDDRWRRRGPPIRQLHELRFGFDSWGAPPLRIWIDGLAIKTATSAGRENACGKGPRRADGAFAINGIGQVQD